jgi:hypothetical protein
MLTDKYFIHNRVNALVWDDETSTLFIGGRFHQVDNRKISAGLAIWTPKEGLVSFAGGGISQSKYEFYQSEIRSLAYEPISKVSFDFLIDD